MKVYCPVCGMTFWCRVERPENIRKMAKKLHNHRELCSCPDWRVDGSREDWTMTWWQAKRLALIRDSVKRGGNVWRWRPQCQSCGMVSEYSVNSNLNGGSDVEVHHIIPRSQGGSDSPKNLIVLCHKCHRLTYKGGYAGLPASCYDSQEKLPIEVKV